MASCTRDLSSPIALYIRVDRFSMSHENVFITRTVEETSNYSSNYSYSYNIPGARVTCTRRVIDPITALVS